jgi:hemerythrin-like domain-containing protein
MSSVVDVLGEDHRRCDSEFAAAEAAAGAGDLQRCAALFRTFRGSLLRHFRLEEEILFPGFEAAIGDAAGPTQMMRQEHDMMRELIDAMQNALDARSCEDYLGAADTLMVLMQQHNMKEEGILYPMCDGVLSGRWDAMHMQMQDMPLE